MSIGEEKKESILLYLTEKINCGDASAVKKTSEAFSVTPASVYKYLNEMIEKGIITKEQRGKYKLVKTRTEKILHRSAGELVSEQNIFDDFVLPYIDASRNNIYIIWQYVIDEMVNNVIDHSGAETLKIIIEKDFLNTSIYLCDDGVGIFDKIKNHFGFDTPDDAISELFKGKLTTDSKNHSGEGIFFSSRMTDNFVIYSSGKVFTHNKFDPGDIQRIFPSEEAKKGTNLFMQLSNTAKKTAAEIFDEYADVDNGFTKTKIKISTYFDSAPVSRSQAKRLCNRLNSFKEVVLDFSDIEWMGQGFAHQLFVVFTTDNPGVSLIPVSMCEDVARMYRHVIASQDNR